MFNNKILASVKYRIEANDDKNNKLKEIIEFNAKYMENVTVRINQGLPSVTIKDDDGEQEDIYLQDDEADTFIKEVEELESQCPDIESDKLELSVAKQYVDSLWN